MAARTTSTYQLHILCIPQKIQSFPLLGTQNKTSVVLQHLRRSELMIMQVYIVDAEGKSEPKELTSGKQGATHGPVFSKQGDKVAWVELDLDGYESDR